MKKTKRPDPEKIKSKEALIEALLWKIEGWYEDHEEDTAPNFFVCFDDEHQIAKITNMEVRDFLFMFEQIKSKTFGAGSVLNALFGG